MLLFFAIIERRQISCEERRMSAISNEKISYTLMILGTLLFRAYTFLGAWHPLEKGIFLGYDIEPLRPADVFIGHMWAGLAVLLFGINGLVLVLGLQELASFYGWALLCIIGAPLFTYIEIYFLLRKGSAMPTDTP